MDGAVSHIGMSEHWTIRYLRHAIEASQMSASAIASGAQISSTTLTRPLNNPEHPYHLSSTTVEKVAQVTGVSPIPFMNLATMESMNVPLPERPKDGSALVPVYDVEASAGYGLVVNDYEAVVSQLSFPPGYLTHITKTDPQHLAIISITGSSMSPTLNHDDIVMVDSTKKNIAYDGMFVVRHEDLLKVKRLRWGRGKATIVLMSDNKRDYADEEVAVEDIDIVGRVVWTGVKQP